MQSVAFKNCQNKSIMEIRARTCVILKEVCDESLVLDAQQGYSEECPVHGHGTASVQQAKTNHFLSVFLTVSPQPAFPSVSLGLPSPPV